MRGTRGNEVEFGQARQAASRWVTGVGLLAAHISAFLLAGVGLLLLNLFRSPTALWVDRPLLVWLVVLGAHATLVGVARVARSTPGAFHRPVVPRRVGARVRRPPRKVQSNPVVPPPASVRPRFRPKPAASLAEVRPTTQDLTTRGREMAERGLAMAGTLSQSLGANGRELWQRAAPRLRLLSEVRPGLGRRRPLFLKVHDEDRLFTPVQGEHLAEFEQVTRPRPSDTAPMTPTDGWVPASVPLESVAVAVEPVPDMGTAAQPLHARPLSPSPDEVTGAVPSPWGPLPSWARMRPHGAEADVSEGSGAPEREDRQSAVIPTRAWPTPIHPISPGVIGGRATGNTDDVLLHEAPAVTKETEWTWMEAAAASWLARRERYERTDLAREPAGESVEETPPDPERLHA